MRRLKAVFLVSLVGAASGAVIGVLSALPGIALPPAIAGELVLFWLGVPAGFGAAWGAVLGPLLGFGLLPHVPLGRAAVGLGGGALAGVVGGVLLGPGLEGIVVPGGILLAAALMRWRATRALVGSPGTEAPAAGDPAV